MRDRTLRLLAVLLAATLVASACGDGDDGDVVDTEQPGEVDDVVETEDVTPDTEVPDTELDEATEDGAEETMGAEFPDDTLRIGLAYGVTDSALETITERAIRAVEVVESLAEEAGMDVELLIEDTAGDPQTGVDAANALISQDIDCMLGAARSNVTTPIVATTAEAQIPQISWGSTSPALTTIDDDDFFFRSLVSDAAQGAVAGRYAAEELGATTAAIVVQNDPYGLGLGNFFEQSFTAAGGEIVASLALDTGTTDFSAEVDEVVSSNPEVIFNVLFAPEFIPFVQELAQAEPAAVERLFTADAQNNVDATDGIEDLLAGVTGIRPTSADLSAFATFFEAQTGEETGTFTEYSFDAAMFCVLAAAAAGEYSGPAIRDEIRDVTSGGQQYTFDQAVEAIQAAAAGEDVDYVGAGSSADLDENGDIDPEGAAYAVYVFNDDGTVSDTGEVLTFEG